MDLPDILRIPSEKGIGMKKKILILFAVIVLCFPLCGCSLWMDGQYTSIRPHEEQKPAPDQEVEEISNYTQLRDALVNLVSESKEKALFSIALLDQDKIDSFMEQAISYVMNDNAVGAYSVDDIRYELGTNSGKPALSLNISYIHDRTQMLRIQRAETMEDAEAYIAEALENCDANVVVRISRYNELDLLQMIQDYGNTHPDTVMEIPQVNVAVFPDRGAERIIEITFTYQTSREALRSMQNTVGPIFTSAELYVSSDSATEEKYSQLYSFLMQRFDYKIQTSITPAYSLLRHGIGDCRAFSNVYSAMCRRAGLDCQTVSGTRNGEAWYWNVICIDGVNYHLDLLSESTSTGFSLKHESEMNGYVWDYSAYPASVE